MESQALALSFAVLGLSYGLVFRLEMFKNFCHCWFYHQHCTRFIGLPQLQCIQRIVLMFLHFLNDFWHCLFSKRFKIKQKNLQGQNRKRFLLISCFPFPRMHTSRLWVQLLFCSQMTSFVPPRSKDRLKWNFYSYLFILLPFFSWRNTKWWMVPVP